MPTIATAGHIDHGKTALITALTGSNPDRLEEEKSRGLTIDLGFAWMALDSGQMLAFVDVPGHQKFIGNMLAGVGAIDACLFVVSAREKMMPQSFEHLHILEGLGISHGIVALTKCAGMSREELDSAEAEIRQKLKNSSFVPSEYIRVSALENQGMDEMRLGLNRLIQKAPPALDLGRPRLWIDRSFSMAGSGTVVTGTLTLGHIAAGDELDLLPCQKRLRVRAIQSLGNPVESAGPGTRVALNLAGATRQEISRGDVLVLRQQWFETRIFDAQVKVLSSDISENYKIKRRGSYTAYLGSGNFPVRIAVLGQSSIARGESGNIRVFLKHKLPLKVGDKFILRDSGRRQTAGGGEILDLDPILAVSKAEPDISAERILAERGGWMDAQDFRLLAEPGLFNLDFTDFENLEQIGGIAAGGIVALKTLKSRIQKELMEKIQSAGQLGLKVSGMSKIEREILNEMAGIIVRAGSAHIGSHLDTHIDGHLRKADGPVSHPYLDLLEENLFSPPSPEDNIDAETLRNFVQTGMVIKAGGIFFSPRAIEEAKCAVAELLSVSPQGFTVSEIRKKLNTSRKYILGLLEYLDESGVTKRRGDVRLAGRRLQAT